LFDYAIDLLVEAIKVSLLRSRANQLEGKSGTQHHYSIEVGKSAICGLETCPPIRHGCSTNKVRRWNTPLFPSPALGECGHRSLASFYCGGNFQAWYARRRATRRRAAALFMLSSEV